MTMGRPSEFDHDRVLDAAMQLFWQKGYEATSLADLLNTMGLSKSSLYQTFGSKHELFDSCLSLYKDKLVADMQAALDNAGSARQFIEQLFYDVATETKSSATRRGCLVMNTASEFAQRDPVVSRRIAASTRAFSKVFSSAVRQAQDEGEIPASHDPDVLASYLVSSMTGLRTMVKAGASRNKVTDIAKIILAALD
jgi:TetR/AcrR family transcriptional repressor of nem operon